MLAITFSNLEDLSTLWTMGEPEKKKGLTGQMFSAVCHYL